MGAVPGLLYFVHSLLDLTLVLFLPAAVSGEPILRSYEFSEAAQPSQGVRTPI